MTTRVRRRAFLRVVSATALAGVTRTWRPADAHAQDASGLEARAHELLRAFDAQGQHRTGTAVDRASGEWLRRAAARAGGQARLVPFDLDRVDVVEAYVELGGRRIEGLPLFDGGTTDAAGVSAPVAPDGVHLAIADRAAIGTEGGFLAGVRRAGPARAIVVVTETAVPGLVPSNARAFTAPYGCPVLQVASEARGALEAAARSGAVARVVCRLTRARTTALNVIVEVPGTSSGAAPLVVITPRSGWWTGAGERGGGLVCWLEAIRALSAQPPGRRAIFVASSGHELGHLGLDAFLHAHEPLLQAAHAWVHLGANIGAGTVDTPGAGVRLQASHDELDDLMSGALSAAGAPVADHLARGLVPAGEARNLHVGGARYVSLLGQSNPWFHHQDDRYPGAVTASRVARYADGVARAVLELARL